MGREFIVRQLQDKDFNDLWNNYLARYEEKERNPKVHIGLPESKPALREEKEWFTKMMRGVKDATSVVSVAEMDGKVVGYCTASPLNWKKERSHIGFLGVSVLEDYRALGIGSALIEDVFEKAKGIFEAIVLEVFSTNPAKALYERLGFSTYGVLRGGIRHRNEKIDIFLMRRDTQINKS